MRIDLPRELQSLAKISALFDIDIPENGAEKKEIKGISTDSRTVQAGDLFIAFRGARTDGRNYIDEAVQKGAAAVLSEGAVAVPPTILHWSCESAEAFLLAAAQRWRKQCGACVVAVTGSAGKSTAKEVISAVLGNVPHTAGNYNSSIGMPLSVLSFPAADFWVCELGINHVGEMEKMSRALAPDLAVITNVGSAHLGHFGELSVLLEEKLKVCCGMEGTGRVLLPYNLKKVAFSIPLAGVFSFGTEKEGDFCLTNISMDEMGVCADLQGAGAEITNLTWPIPGVVGKNAIAIGGSVGALCGRSEAQIREGLRQAAAKPLRQSVFPLGNYLVLEDCYNASPEACAAAFEILRYLGGTRPLVAVLGDMLELGTYSPFLHRALGAALQREGFSQLYTYGAAAAGIAEGAREAGMPSAAIRSFAVGEEEVLAQSVLHHAPPRAALLFKGAHAMHMERIVAQIRRFL